MLRIKILILSILIYILYPVSPLFAIGENIDPVLMNKINMEITTLHEKLKKDSENCKIYEKLLGAYDRRKKAYLKGEDFEADLMIKKLSEELLELDSNNFYALFYNALVKFREKEWDIARKYVQKAIKIKKTPRLLLLLAKLEFKFINLKKAYDDASKVVLCNDSKISNEGKSLVKKYGKYIVKLKFLKDKIAQKKESPKPKLKLAKFYLSPEFLSRRKNISKTLDYVKELVKKNPDYIDGQLFLIKIYLKYLKKYKKAEEVARELLKKKKLSLRERKETTNLLNKALMRK